MEIKFQQRPEVHSQQTLVTILKRYKYYFVPVIEQDNRQFYLVLDGKVDSGETNGGAIKKVMSKLTGDKNGPHNTVLKYAVMDGNDAFMSVPIVFTRADILDIVKDVPDTYIGEETL